MTQRESELQPFIIYVQIKISILNCYHLQVAWSKPFEGLVMPGAACASSQTLTQHRVQPAPPALQPRPQDLGEDGTVKILDPSEVAFQVRLPPVPGSVSPLNKFASSPPFKRQDVEVKIVDASSTSSSPTRTTSESPINRRPLGSLDRMKASLSKDSGGFDSGFSSAEQQWSDIDTARNSTSTESSAEGEVDPGKALLSKPRTTFTPTTTKETTPLMSSVTIDEVDDLPPPPFCDDDDLPPPPPSPPRTDLFLSGVMCSTTHTVV
jgi:hypothetical protein